MKRMISFIILAFILTGCASQTSTKEVNNKNYSKFLADTKEITALFEDVYKTEREFTAKEEMAVNEYEAKYKEDGDTNIKLISNEALILYYDAKRLSGVEDTFADDLERLNRDIADIESNK